MGRIYDVGASPRGMELMSDIMDAAYTKRDAVAERQNSPKALFAT